jgi:hypothetical protein
MISKKSLAIGFTGIALLVVSLVSLSLTFPASAQCGGPGESASSCKTCHEEQDPVDSNGEWHIIHAEKDICINCHGGNGTTMDKTLAHQEMTVHPLSDIYTDCHSCHPYDYAVRAQIFAPTLGVTPGSCATPTAVARGSSAEEPPAGNLVIPSNLESRSIQSEPPLLIVGSGLFMLLLFCLCLRWLSIHPRS